MKCVRVESPGFHRRGDISPCGKLLFFRYHATNGLTYEEWMTPHEEMIFARKQARYSSKSRTNKKIERRTEYRIGTAFINDVRRWHERGRDAGTIAVMTGRKVSDVSLVIKTLEAGGAK